MGAGRLPFPSRLRWDELTARIRALLRRASGEKALFFKVGDLALNA